MKYYLLVFGLTLIVSLQSKAQQFFNTSLTKQNIQISYLKAVNYEVGTSIFGSYLSSNWVLKPSEIIFNESHFSNSQMPINSPQTPKDAIFCQFENRLWKSFDIGIRLRVETPPPSH